MDKVGPSNQSRAEMIRQMAENEVSQESAVEAKEKVKKLLLKKKQAQQVLNNIEGEIADALADIDKGNAL